MSRMKSVFFKERIFPVLFMVGVTFVFVAFVSGAFLTTQDRIRVNESLFLKRAVLYAANIPVPEDAGQVDSLYRQRIREVTKNGKTSYEVIAPAGSASTGEQVVGEVVISRGPGLWGELVLAIGFNARHDQLLGIEFIEQNETPGLGGRISEPQFKEQFRQKTGPFRLVPEGVPAKPDEINAITGATQTSQFVIQIMNRTFNDLKTGN
jgi:Na+-transporting NADH:ubiquinone oxidoreductase subunit C